MAVDAIAHIQRPNRMRLDFSHCRSDCDRIPCDRRYQQPNQPVDHKRMPPTASAMFRVLFSMSSAHVHRLNGMYPVERIKEKKIELKKFDKRFYNNNGKIVVENRWTITLLILNMNKKFCTVVLCALFSKSSLILGCKTITCHLKLFCCASFYEFTVFPCDFAMKMK